MAEARSGGHLCTSAKFGQGTTAKEGLDLKDQILQNSTVILLLPNGLFGILFSSHAAEFAFFILRPFMCVVCVVEKAWKSHFGTPS